MTKEEILILNQLSAITKRIKNLPVLYNDPENIVNKEVQVHVNALEHIVFAREGVRAYKKQYAKQALQKLSSTKTTKEVLKKVLRKNKKYKIDVPGFRAPNTQYGRNVDNTANLKKLFKGAVKKQKWTKKDTAELKDLQQRSGFTSGKEEIVYLGGNTGAPQNTKKNIRKKSVKKPRAKKQVPKKK